MSMARILAAGRRMELEICAAALSDCADELATFLEGLREAVEEPESPWPMQR